MRRETPHRGATTCWGWGVQPAPHVRATVYDGHNAWKTTARAPSPGPQNATEQTRPRLGLVPHSCLEASPTRTNAACPRHHNSSPRRGRPQLQLHPSTPSYQNQTPTSTPFAIFSQPRLYPIQPGDTASPQVSMAPCWSNNCSPRLSRRYRSPFASTPHPASHASSAHDLNRTSDESSP